MKIMQFEGENYFTWRKNFFLLEVKALRREHIALIPCCGLSSLLSSDWHSKFRFFSLCIFAFFMYFVFVLKHLIRFDWINWYASQRVFFVVSFVFVFIKLIYIYVGVCVHTYGNVIEQQTATRRHTIQSFQFHRCASASAATTPPSPSSLSLVWLYHTI